MVYGCMISRKVNANKILYLQLKEKQIFCLYGYSGSLFGCFKVT